MIILFDQNIKYYNHNNKILLRVSHIALQATTLIGTTEHSSSVPGSSDRHALLLTESDLEIILYFKLLRYTLLRN